MPQTVWLKTQTFISQGSSEAEKCETVAPGWLSSDEVPSWLADSCLLAVASYQCRERQEASSLVSSDMDSNPIMMTSSRQYMPSKPPLPVLLQMPSHWGLGLQCMHLGDTNTQSMGQPNLQDEICGAPAAIDSWGS